MNQSIKDHPPSSTSERTNLPFLAPSGSHEKSPIYRYMQEVFNSELLRRIPFLDHQRSVQRFNQLMKAEPRPNYEQEFDSFIWC